MQNTIINNNEEKIRLMIVDDHKLFRCGIKSLFKNSSCVCVVAEASNGKEGISKIVAQNPDVVLLDLELGDINGLDLIEKVAIDSLNENNELVTNKGTDFYYELLQILDEYLDFYKLVSFDDKEIISEEKWLNPCIIFVKDGKIVSFISNFNEEDNLNLKEVFEKNLENICDGKC